MSEATPETPTTPAPEASVAPAAEQTPKTFSQEDVNALLAKQKREQFGDYGDLKKAAERLSELEEAQKTEQERAAEAARKAQEDAAAARSEALRYKAAATHGISADYFDLLGSGDEESIAGRAERVGSLLRENASMKAELEALRAGKPAPTTARPVEALKPGATPEHTQTEDDVLYNSLFGG